MFSQQELDLDVEIEKLQAQLTEIEQEKANEEELPKIVDQSNLFDVVCKLIRLFFSFSISFSLMFFLAMFLVMLLSNRDQDLDHRKQDHNPNHDRAQDHNPNHQDQDRNHKEQGHDLNHQKQDHNQDRDHEDQDRDHEDQDRDHEEQDPDRDQLKARKQPKSEEKISVSKNIEATRNLQNQKGTYCCFFFLLIVS